MEKLTYLVARFDQSAFPKALNFVLGHTPRGVLCSVDLGGTA